MINLVKMGLMY